MGKQQGNVNDVAVAEVSQEVATYVREVMPEPEGGWPADEFTGQAGNYVRDPYTGVRSPASDLA